MSIALALIKRLREIVLGLPSLAAWQWLEHHRGPDPSDRSEAPQPLRAAAPFRSDTGIGSTVEAALDYGDAS